MAKRQAASADDEVTEAVSETEIDDTDSFDDGLEVLVADDDLDEPDLSDDDDLDDDLDDDDLDDDGLPDETLEAEDLDDLEEDELAAAVASAAGTFDDDEIVAVVVTEDDEDDDTDGLDGIRDGEFVCRSCHLARRETQLADAKRLLCRDCA